MAPPSPREQPVLERRTKAGDAGTNEKQALQLILRRERIDQEKRLFPGDFDNGDGLGWNARIAAARNPARMLECPLTDGVGIASREEQLMQQIRIAGIPLHDPARTKDARDRGSRFNRHPT
ncbi:hypothetical protein JQ592_18625 [Bradyrhizobium iriomotense]|nr:hypothetical protein [Bradyrhizobium iriomotense]MBR1130312.1 hypothetical protein [Bradyrhizobium iriomotense]